MDGWMDGVYVGYHEDRFPEIPADKHREHVVRVRARAPINTALKTGCECLHNALKKKQTGVTKVSLSIG